jgi:hypothetical protein
VHSVWAFLSCQKRSVKSTIRCSSARFWATRRSPLGPRPQSTGRVAKSTLAQGLISWMRFAGIDFAAVDADTQHRTLSCRYPDKVSLFDATRSFDDFSQMIQELPPAPVILVDFPAQVGLPAQECRLRLKRPPSSSRMLARRLPFISSTAFRALAAPAFFCGTQSCRFAFGRKNMAQHIFPFEANSKIIPRRLLLRRRASPRWSQRNSRFTVPPRYPAWSISHCLSVTKRLLRL